MKLDAEQLPAHLQRGLRRLYTVYGDEPLLAQEAADAIRAAARAAGFAERKVFSVSGGHFDWSGLLGASQAMSLFADRQLIEIRIPSGKPGKEGSEALQRYCESLSDDVLTLVQLPRLDFQQLKSGWFAALDAAGVTLRVDPVERRDLPAWIARRLQAQGQRVADGEEGQRTLAFFADRVEGNLLAAHQELQKLALLHPPGVLGFEQVEAAVLVHWTLAEDLRVLKRLRDAVDGGRPLAVALREQRVWGVKERLFERVLPQLADHQLAHLLQSASVCDGIVKGLPHAQWPVDPWQALQRLALLVMQSLRPVPVTKGRAPLMMRLALEA